MGFSSVLSQEKAVEVLRLMHARKLRPPFLLFYGPKGAGKKKAAFEFAASVLCPSPDPEDGSCGRCEVCSRIARGAHPDVFLVNLAYQQSLEGARAPAASLKIDTIREALRLASLKPFGSGLSFCLVDGADALTLQAQNAALKALEEASAHLIWIWMVSSEESLLPTIVSRASFKVRFAPLEESAAAVLIERELGASQAQAQAAAKLCLGSLERARRILDMGVSSLDDQESNFQSPKEIFNLSQRMARFRNFVSSRKAISEFLEELIIRLMRRWRENADASALQGVRLALSAQKDLETNLNPPLVLEHLLLKLGQR